MRKQNLPSPSCLQPQPGRPHSPRNHVGALLRGLSGPPHDRACTLQMWRGGSERQRPKSPGQITFFFGPFPAPGSLECHSSLGQIGSLYPGWALPGPGFLEQMPPCFVIWFLHLENSHLNLRPLTGLLCRWEEIACAREPGKQKRVVEMCVAEWCRLQNNPYSLLGCSKPGGSP